MKSMQQALADWRKKRTSYEKLNKDIPRIMGSISVRVVKENFTLQGYDSGTGVEAWKERDEKTNKAYDKRSGVKGTVYQSGNPLLMQTRNLYNSVKYWVVGKVVKIGVDIGLIPYAAKMNDQRKYMPDPNEKPNIKMIKRFKKKIQTELDRIFKK